MLEGEVEPRALLCKLAGVQFLEHELETGGAHQVLDKGGRRAVPVLELFEYGEYLVLGGDRRESLVEVQPLLRIRYVVLWYVLRDTEVYLGLYGLFRLFTLYLPHRLLKELSVEVKADLGDIAGLRRAEELSGAPYLEVVCRHPEA